MSGIVKPLFYEPLKHIYKLIFNDTYRTYSFLESKLRKMPRFTQCRVKVHGWELLLPDSASFLSAYKEIFLNRIYEFKCSNPNPVILDLGANVGLSVLFFKSLYPRAEITAFEADPNIYQYLKTNIHENGFTDVKLLNQAAWFEDTVLKFNSEGADGGRIPLDGDQDLIEVDAADISKWLKNKVDFLKIDIEGAEDFVLPACRDYLSNVKLIFVEYHSKIGQPQRIHNLMEIMSEAGFRLHIHSIVSSPIPFVKVINNSDFDMQLNIFGWKES